MYPVRGFNLVAENSIDARVLDVLDRKLAVILAEFGADKRADIIESVSGHTDSIYTGALGGDADLERSAEQLLERTRSELQEQADLRDLLPSNTGHPRTTGDHLSAALRTAATAWEQLQGQRIGDLADVLDGLPSVAPGEPVPQVSGHEAGWWGVWEAKAEASSSARTAFALFIAHSGGVRPDVADWVWDSLMQTTGTLTSTVPPGEVWDQLARTALDYAYRPCTDLAGGHPPTVPMVRPLLIVQVSP